MEKKIPNITIPTEDGLQTYHVPDDGGVEIYNAETGELIIYLTRSPGYIYPLLKLLAERCPDLMTSDPDFAKYRKEVNEFVAGGITGQRPVVTSLQHLNRTFGHLRKK